MPFYLVIKKVLPTGGALIYYEGQSCVIWECVFWNCKLMIDDNYSEAHKYMILGGGGED